MKKMDPDTEIFLMRMLMVASIIVGVTMFIMALIWAL